jgi:hypothetical protein
MNSKRAGALCLIIALGVGLGARSEEVRSPALAADGSDGAVVTIEGDRLTVILTQFPLQAALQEIARQTGLRIVSHSPLDDRLSLTLADLPLEDGLRRLLGPHHAVFLHGPAGKLEEIRVHAVSPSTEPPAIPALSTETMAEEPAAAPPTLTDREPAPRLAAAAALAGTGEHEAALRVVLHVATSSAQAELRERALDLLALFGNVPTDSVADVVRFDPEPALRWQAAELLGRLAKHDPAARRALRELAGEAFDEALRKEVEAMLGRLGGSTDN